MKEEFLFKKIKHYLGKIEILKSSDTQKYFLTFFLNDDKIDEDKRNFYEFYITAYLSNEGFITDDMVLQDVRIIFLNELPNVQPSAEWNDEEDFDDSDNE